MSPESQELNDRINADNAAALLRVGIDPAGHPMLMGLLHAAAIRGVTLGAEIISAKVTASVALRMAALESRHPGEPRQH